ncbi:MAG: threonine/serine exporter family protein [Bacillota bacterium]|nr:threonine/serine exporter family protein [Bacillota bacterium]
MVTILQQFLLALFATFGFAIIFRVPKKLIPVSIIVGALGWITYLIAVYYFDSPVIGCFIAACLVGLCSTIAAYALKNATTVFIIPGILCLVPGAKIFYTMEALLRHDYAEMTETGVLTLMMAGAIAMGLLVMGACTGVVRALVRKTVTLKDKL